MSTDTLFNSLNLKLAVGFSATAGLVYYLCNRRTNSKSDYDDNNASCKENVPINNCISDDNSAALGFKTQGNKFFTTEDYEKAIEFYTKAIEICIPNQKKDLAIFYYNRAFSFEKLQKYDEALSDVNTALEFDKRYKKAFLKRGKLHEHFGDYYAALIDFSALNCISNFSSEDDKQLMDNALENLINAKMADLKADGNIVIPGKYTLNSIKDSFANDPIFSHDLLKNGLDNENYMILEKAKKLFFNRQIFKALELIESLANNGDYLAILFRGTINILIGYSAKAVEDFHHILNNAEEIANKSIIVNATLKLANWHLMNQDYDNCEKMLMKALDMDYNDPDVHAQLGKFYLNMENFNKSYNEFKTSLQFKETVHNLSNFLYAEFRLAVENNNSSILNNLDDKFRGLFNKYPEDVTPYFVYAQILMQLQRITDAEKCYSKALEIDEENPMTWFHKALFRFQLALNGDETITYLEKAIELDDTLAEALDLLAKFEIQRKNVDRSLELFEKSLKVTVYNSDIAERIRYYYLTSAQAHITKNYDL